MRFFWGSAVLSVAVGCSQPVPQLSKQGEIPGDATGCPEAVAAANPLPGVAEEHRSAEFWIQQIEAANLDPDAVVLSPEAIADHNAALTAHTGDEPLGQFDLTAPIDRAALLEELNERLGFMRGRIEQGEYVDGAGERLGGEELAAFDELDVLPNLTPELRVSLRDIPIRCGPRGPGLYKAPGSDKAFDRNNCSTLRAQEPVRILASMNGMKLVRSRYSLGWINATANELSPALDDERARLFVAGDALRSDGDGPIAANTFLASPGGQNYVLATPDGFESGTDEGATSSRRPLTRRAVYEEAFRYLDTPYGWGGEKSGRDCSRFVMDVFASFGLDLPRHSGTQSKAGSMRIDVSKVDVAAKKLDLIDAAHKRGIVLLHFPGHIMLYLGRNQQGAPMVVHAFAEYLEPCTAEDAKASGRQETLMKVDKISVSDLSLGHDTSRTSFIERLSAITLLAQTPGPELVGVAERRFAAPRNEAPTSCEDSTDVTMLVSPLRPHPGEPVRVVVASSNDLGSVAINLSGPDGAIVRPELRRLGGPPFGYWAELDAPAAGEWTAWIGDGDRVEACKAIKVGTKRKRQAGGGPVWRPQRRWNAATENLFAMFIEQLFDYPPDQDLTWPNLSELLGNRANNLLYNHLGQEAEARMHLEPDCADLPYFLRAYFSWKLRLPFGYRHCNRGRSGRAPYCDPDIHSNMMDRENSDEAKAFSHFARLDIANGVHSGSGRTAPEDNKTDYYPVPLTRGALRPGTMFADPYGHLFVIAAWVPQGIDDYGVLIGADAQPDGTVGRRRFWRGSFLFKPETDEAGAGFKHFRPVVLRSQRVRAVDNEDIAARGMTPFSMQQYEVGKDGFYDRVEALINPRPLDPKSMQTVLIEALHEQVKRRVVSVNNAVEHKRTHRRNIEMPRGHAIFETTGPWENFSTPSRDMRLLIAMDTVLGFPATVQRTPERFGIAADKAGEAAAALERYLDAELPLRTFSYTRSDGSTFALTLKDVVDRAQAFEMAYNPNDCVEVRWSAPDGSDERSTCATRAPEFQHDRMAGYRDWFATRTRPAR